jgi:RNA polymerase sigma factor (TIGR02999 family)
MTTANTTGALKRQPTQDVTMLLMRWKQGQPEAFQQLLPLVYQELRRLAHGHLQRERAGHTLQPTALIHEAYLRLARQHTPDWQNRQHFFGIASRLMRQILVEYARAHATAKRGGGAETVSIEEAMACPQERARELIALDDALTALAQFDERKAHIIELRYFGGMNLEETAAALALSPTTINHETRLARAWLLRELRK